MTINLKIELLKVFSLEFTMTSDNKKKAKDNAQETAADDKPAGGDTKPSK